MQDKDFLEEIDKEIRKYVEANKDIAFSKDKDQAKINRNNIAISVLTQFYNIMENKYYANKQTTAPSVGKD